jgi:hypothetical protein
MDKERRPMNLSMEHLPKLYRELADWWPILSAPEEYAEEAAFYEKALRAGCSFEPMTLLGQHRCGLFSHDQWLQWMTEAGFEASSVPFVHSEIPPGDCEIFVGRKPTNARS